MWCPFARGLVRLGPHFNFTRGSMGTSAAAGAWLLIEPRRITLPPALASEREHVHIARGLINGTRLEAHDPGSGLES